MPRKIVLFLAIATLFASAGFARAEMGTGAAREALLAQIASVIESLREQLSRFVALKIIQSPGSGGSLSPSLKPAEPAGGTAPANQSAPASVSSATTGGTAVAVSPTTGRVVLTRQLGLGTNGDDVLLYQKKLAEWGYLTGGSERVTGYFGAATREATKLFQGEYISQLGLLNSDKSSLTGSVGSRTLRLWNSEAVLGASSNRVATPGDASRFQEFISGGVPMSSLADCSQLPVGSIAEAACRAIFNNRAR